MLDPHRDRFNQTDPLADFSTGLSTYGFSSNNPICRLVPWGLKDTLFKRELVQRDPDLATVFISPERKNSFGGFCWPTYSKSENKTWGNKKNKYNRRRESGHSIIQGRESKLFLNNIRSFKRRFEAEEDGRKMSMAAVVIMAAPIAGTAFTEALTTRYAWSFVHSAAINLFQNNGDYKRMDLFDISVNAVNPFKGVSGSLWGSGLNSLVDINPGQDRPLSYLGNGKNTGQVGIGFSYGLFGEATK